MREMEAMERSGGMGGRVGLSGLVDRGVGGFYYSRWSEETKSFDSTELGI